MKTRTDPHQRLEPRTKECTPCEIPAFCRNNYFTGKLMTARDFTQEQLYNVDKLRLHHLALHGWGVVCGLMVKPHPHCPELRLIVEPGLAIDGCGREIRIVKEVEIPLLERKTVKPPKEPCTAEPPPQSYAGRQTAPPDQEQHPTQYQEQHPTQYGPEQQGYGQQPQPPDSYEPLTPLWVCIRYKECETEFMPAPFDECACTADGQKPNRICEWYQVTLESEEPEWMKKRNGDCEVSDCSELSDKLLEKCPDPTALECIPLAFIKNYRPGDKVEQEMIDNKVRPRLRSTRVLDELIQCILKKLPTKQLTRIEDIGWVHDKTYRYHEFMRYFVSDNRDQSRALEVTFSGPVIRDGVTPYTFQAVAVRHPDRNKIGGPLELVPAEVTINTDTSRGLARTQAYLHLEREYIERHCRNAEFDLYITVKCDLIVDEKGVPIDGNLLARLDVGGYTSDPPTGDGIPGGKFESWIHVVP
jgi:hypothetical protein